MKFSVKLISLLLCAAMLLGIAGCGSQPAPTETPTQATAQPVFQSLYQQAAASVENAEFLTFQIASETTIRVGGETFTEKAARTFARSSEAFHSVTTLTYGEETVVFDELYQDGTKYVTVDKTYRFSGPFSWEDYCGDWYLPKLPVDETLYGSQVTDGNTVTFSDPTAAESWAMPEGAELTDAAASITVGADGRMEQITYAITYQYGSATISLDMDIAVEFEADLPEVNPDDGYTLLENIYAPRLFLRAKHLLNQSGEITTSQLESIMTQAAGVVRNQSTIVNRCGNVDDLLAKIETSVYMMNYATNQETRSELEEVYRDNVYTYTEDDNEPESRQDIEAELIADYCDEAPISNFVPMEYWKEAKLSDLGSTQLIEFSFSNSYGETVQDDICTLFWNDADFLNKLSTSHGSKEVSGYLAIDTYTGLPTAAGYYYEGYHTIQDYDYILTFQSDQSIEIPASSAYFNITDEMPYEEEPEEKATPLFYHVTGENGQEMWLFGTIHVGDERTAYLPQEIYDALSSADALALEYYSNGFDALVEEDEALQEQVSSCYYYSDGTTTADHVDAEIYDTAVSYLKASGNYTMNAPYMKPSLWSQSIENFYQRQGYQLTSAQGCESRLEKLAEDQGKEILDVESGLFQIKMLTGWSEELQELLLEESLECTGQEYWESTYELYEKWCAGDETELREMLSDAVDTSELTEEELAEYEEQKHLIDEYNKAMSYDRNDGMLKVAIDYLESGKVVFYAVGLAHLLNDVNGLVDTLRDAGYTVEPVQYAQ